MDHAFYVATCNLKMFTILWGIRNILCSLGEDDMLILHFRIFFVFVKDHKGRKTERKRGKSVLFCDGGCFAAPVTFSL